jgi:arylsulfatase A-like enzyme
MYRQTLLNAFTVALALPLMALHGSRLVEGSDRPNVILVLTDDQGYGDLSRNGNPYVKTPHIDAFAKQAVRLDNYHVNPNCSPTRAALLTGRYASKTGVWRVKGGRGLLPDEEITIADVLSQAGYATSFFGKWHLGDNYPLRPEEHGFKHVLRHNCGGVGQQSDYPGNNYFDATFCENGTWKKFPGYCTDVWFDEAIQWIEANKEKRFFTMISTNAPHAPLVAPPDDRDRLLKRLTDVDERNRDKAANFLGMVENIDKNFGRLRAKLQEWNLENETILIFTTDNGTAGGATVFSGGMRGAKNSVYEGGHRVPFYIRWPGGSINKGKDVQRITAHIDVLPTIAEFCNAKIGQNLDGRSLVPLIRDVNADWPDRVLGVDKQFSDELTKFRAAAMMTDRWRLVLLAEDERYLFDILKDPQQETDVAKQYPAVASRLRAEYEKWWADVSANSAILPAVVIGSPHEPVTALSEYDAHQPHAKEGGGVEQFRRYAVRFNQDGTYRFRIRMDDERLKNVFHANKALLTIGKDIRLEKSLSGPVEEVVFEAEVKAGSCLLEAFLYGLKDTGKSKGKGKEEDERSPANWLYVQKL